MSVQFPNELSQFSAQDIQLELVRRAGGNFDGEKVVQMLLEQRSLWIAALIDTLHVVSHPAVPTFKIPTLYKLRDIHENHWNTDTLYVVTADEASRDKLLNISNDQVGGMPLLYNEDQSQAMLIFCNFPVEYRVFGLWWD